MKTRFSFKPIIMAVLCMAAAVIVPSGVKAQNTSDTWKGCDKDTLNSNTYFFLYNVGTGKFIKAGGMWNTDAMLVLQDYGLPFTLETEKVGTLGGKDLTNQDQTLIHTGMVTTPDAEYFGCNPYEWSSSKSNTYLNGCILDARKSSSFNNNGTKYYWRTWSLERVELASDTKTYTYYLHETIHRLSGNNEELSEWYAGTGWGTDGKEPQNVTIDNNHAVYLEASRFSEITGHTDIKNYQWRLISIAELEDIIASQNGENTGAYAGLNANVTHLLHDPFFDRAQTSFNHYTAGTQNVPTWTVVPSSNVSSSIDNDANMPRYDWTISYNVQQNKSINALQSPELYTILPNNVNYDVSGTYAQPWNSPVLRKLGPSDAAWSNDGDKMRKIQYEMGALEGEGEAYQTVTFNNNGVYALTARAISVGGDDISGYVFAQKEGSTDKVTTTVHKATPSVRLWNQGSSRNNNGTYWVNVDADDDWTTVARELDTNTEYTVGLIFTVSGIGTKTEGNENPVTSVTYRIGLGKTGSKPSFQSFDASRDATQGAGWPTTKTTYKFRHDDSYVAIDEMQLHYLGPDAPFVFNENKTDDKYMRADITGSTATGSTAKKLTNRTTLLKRNASLYCWQPIVLPISLSTEQVRTAFGTDAKLGVLKGVGKVDPYSPTSIDFESVPLSPGKVALHAGQFYLLYATHAPGYAEWTDNGVKNSGLFYALGRNDYDPSAELGDNVEYTNTDNTKTKSIGPSPFSQKISGTAWSGTNKDRDPFTTSDLTIHATWIRTPEDSTGNNLNYVPAGAYVVQDGEMYYLTKPGRINGFKWWITAPENSATTAKGLSFSFIDPSDFVTYIDGVSTDRKPKSAAQRAVYNLAGVRVANDASELQNLPSGIYITGGKKIIKK